jgi:hypothetical protein
VLGRLKHPTRRADQALTIVAEMALFPARGDVRSNHERGDDASLTESAYPFP